MGGGSTQSVRLTEQILSAFERLPFEFHFEMFYLTCSPQCAADKWITLITRITEAIWDVRSH